MKLFFLGGQFALVLCTSVFSANACAAITSPSPEPELLSDGNVRDPEPTPERLKELFSMTRANMVSFSRGQFQMGDWGAQVNKEGLPFDGDRDSKPLHKVTLSAFAIGKFPVTYAEFDIFTAALRLPRINQSSFSLPFRKPNNPVGVTWQGAKDYCMWLGKETGLPYDLVTEAQWEYAARSGGKRHVYPTDNGKSEPGRNTPSYDQRKEQGGLVPVSAFPANAAGIYYMGAGASEWVNDWYDARYYEKSPRLNPLGPLEGEFHVSRGFAGSEESAMTFKRWKLPYSTPRATWTKFGEKVGDPRREIPYTKYSDLPDSAFRCALNIEKK